MLISVLFILSLRFALVSHMASPSLKTKGGAGHVRLHLPEEAGHAGAYDYKLMKLYCCSIVWWAQLYKDWPTHEEKL